MTQEYDILIHHYGRDSWARHIRDELEVLLSDGRIVLRLNMLYITTHEFPTYDPGPEINVKFRSRDIWHRAAIDIERDDTIRDVATRILSRAKIMIGGENDT